MENKLSSERRRLLFTIDRILEAPMIILGFLWLILLVVELVRGLNPFLEFVSLAIWVIFIIDFIIKFILAPVKLEYLKKNWLTAVSLVIPALRVFRVFRLARLLRGLRGVRLVRIVSSLNRGMRSLGKAMKRRAIGYVILLIAIVTFAGAAGMYALERPNPGFNTYGMALWWTAMRVITAGNEFNPVTTEGRGLALIIAIFGYTIFGYVTATFASFFIGRDAEEKDGPVPGKEDLDKLRREIIALRSILEHKKDK